MSNVVNLNKARKAKARDTARKKAEANVVKHGQTKAAKARDKAEQNKAARDLDGHKRE